eukprot:TRINITY_DN15528_c0_g1_i1.p1 TRINITY_DN15528_c0_g1~~TRINITY_DN15528_c0_g1_i1.p1  ORF type:complete len:142 (+),score=26.84 TRINITY_DN15528_c0_g1_i1:61-486(+)
MSSPIETLYVNNLPDKLDKKELKRALYYLFSQYGAIVDIVAMKTPRTRGQAFIAFRQVAVAEAALKDLQGVQFYGKSLRLAFAKSKSESIAKLDGTFRKKSAREKQQAALQKDKDFLMKIKGPKRPAGEVAAVKKVKEESP